MSGTVLAIIGVTGWLTLMVTLWSLCRISAQRDRAQERAHQEWLMRGWDR